MLFWENNSADRAFTNRIALCCRYYVISTLQLLATLTAGIFGFIGLKLYIPVVIALVAALEGLSSTWRVRQRLTDVSTPLDKLAHLLRVFYLLLMHNVMPVGPNY